MRLSVLSAGFSPMTADLHQFSSIKLAQTRFVYHFFLPFKRALLPQNIAKLGNSWMWLFMLLVCSSDIPNMFLSF